MGMIERFAIEGRDEILVLVFNAWGRLIEIKIERDGKPICDMIAALNLAQVLREGGHDQVRVWTERQERLS